VGATAKGQVGSFLDQWRSFAENACGEVQRGVNAQLEHVCAQADALCEALGRDVQLFSQRDQEIEQGLAVLERDAAALKTEFSSAVSQCRAEDAQVRNELAALKNRALETANKTLSLHKDRRQHSGKGYGVGLENALRAM
jgi:predicted  nucleic acid-binding Zn-ribbon protein